MAQLHELAPFEIAHARDFLMRPAAYGPFDLLSDGRRVGGCMDPRPDEIGGERQLIKVMGPGGEGGEAVDHSQALTAVSGRLVTVDEALVDDMGLRRADVHGAHHDCAYLANIMPIILEAADPSDSTMGMVDKWVHDHELHSVVTQERTRRIIGAAVMVAESLEAQGGAMHLADAIDATYPEHHNVPRMQDAPAPHFYIVNGFPHMGLDRHLKHGDAARLRATAYHDNLLARLNDVNNTHALHEDVRLLRMCSLLFRSAATRTVIDRMKRQAGHTLEHWEVEIGRDGAEFRQIDFAAAA